MPTKGMFVRFPEALTITGLSKLSRYGEVRLSGRGREYQFTNQMLPETAGYAAHREKVASWSVLLDDGLSVQNATPVRFLIPDPLQSPGQFIRVGDIVENLVGNIRFSRSSEQSGDENYRLLTQSRLAYIPANGREQEPPEVGGDIKVASVNMLNFFTTLDTGQRICGPSGNGGCRGANSVEEFARHRAKLLSSLSVINADIIGLIEIENNARESLRSITDGLNDMAVGEQWSYVDTGTIGTDSIRVGIIYNPTAVLPAGDFAALDGSVDARFMDNKNRTVLLQTFVHASDNRRFSVAVAHLKSKGSSCSDIGDPDRSDGQANGAGTRTQAAASLVDWLATDPTASGDPDFLIIGDPNAHLQEDAVRKIESGGYISLLASIVGKTAYSFQFQGQSGALDHALSSPSLLPQVAGAAEWHINADEASLLDYNLEFGREADLFDPSSPFRSSDHDPLVIGLSLTSN